MMAFLASFAPMTWLYVGCGVVAVVTVLMAIRAIRRAERDRIEARRLKERLAAQKTATDVENEVEAMPIAQVKERLKKWSRS